MKSFKKSGFTLIELLVVITIIAVLSAIALVAYTSVLKNARDGKRIADLRGIQSSLEEYYADQLFYPSGNLPFGSALTSSTGNSSSPLPSPVKTYYNTLPADPTSGTTTPYVYTAIPSVPACSNPVTKCTSYCLYAKVENNSNAVNLSGCTDVAGYNFEVTLP